MPLEPQPNNRTVVSTQTLTIGGIKLEGGETLEPVTVAYETYGRLNAERSNAILILHALSGDSHAAFYHEGEDKPGWWDDLIGSGKAFDTDQYFIICSNVLGGCRGTTGPSSLNPATGKPYGLDFPIITIRDMVAVQKKLIDHLGIDRLLSVAGGSMGGMQTLEWVASYPEKIRSAIPIATALKHSPQQIAFHEAGRQAVMADANWNDGNYSDTSEPERGLAVARMIGHITYMSDKSMAEKFGRQTHVQEAGGKKFSPKFEVEGYLQARGDSFVKRFDANSYLYITKAIDLFDGTRGGRLEQALVRHKPRFLVLCFSSDWLYPPYQSKEIALACKLAGTETAYCEIESNYGHDSFLVETEQESKLIGHFLANVGA